MTEPDLQEHRRLIQRKEMLAEVGKLAREFAVLQKEVALERGFQALKAEIATARAEVPKLPDIKAKQSELETEVARFAERTRVHQGQAFDPSSAAFRNAVRS